MKPRFFEGEAGSGKTTALIDTLVEHLAKAPLGDDERVLALTFMHGARRRLDARLSELAKLGRRFDCQTFDRFAWELTQRWRTLGLVLYGSVGADYDANCYAAAALLAQPCVAKWLRRRYAVVVIDELQDLGPARLAIVKALRNSTPMFVAADAFQELSPAVPVNEPVRWMRDEADVTVLKGNHRTHQVPLLSAASALRNGEPLQAGPSFGVVGAPSAALAAAVSAARLFQAKGSEVVFLTPTKKATATFVHEVLRLLRSGEAKLKQKAIKALRIEWEADEQADRARIASAIGLDQVEATVTVHYSDLTFDTAVHGTRTLRDNLLRRRALTGSSETSVSDLREQIDRVVHQLHSNDRRATRRLRVMTIHQAKNREFDGVIVLWPYQVVPEDEPQRRLLYNAVTRAKQWAVVIVQDGKGDRITKAPFHLPAQSFRKARQSVAKPGAGGRPA